MYTAKKKLTLIGGKFTVSGFSRSYEIRGNDHWGETYITVVLPHQRPECKPTGTNYIIAWITIK